MFKKRTRPANVRTKDTPSVNQTPTSTGEPLDPSEAVASPAVEENDEPNVEATIQDLMSLRRFRKQAEGLSLEKLNRGEIRRRKKKTTGTAEEGEEEGEDDGEEEIQVGLRPGKGSGGKEIDPSDESAKMKRLISASNFTQQTNALDVDKHMMAYIETELQKRRGIDTENTSDAAASSSVKPFDPHEALYEIAEQYRIEKKKDGKNGGEDDEEGGNVMNSMAMLTAIPEVDLGMDNRLKNIEDTEKAKRAMLEARKKAAPRPSQADNDFAAARFYRPVSNVQSDKDALEDARREAMGLPAIDRKNRNSKNYRNKSQVSNDEITMERFKKRIKKY
ncbi:Uncharacterized conserved protein [Phaffia rhodozyma]|uniref:Uncharacterized conserved protein n=1 Tax=Phaffia rhodozyma TaxID=264483 RepID=A0A0F7SNF2_PHARH|nr:Uncharacterized conserved protein [Phaffia rhodozyma]